MAKNGNYLNCKRKDEVNDDVNVASRIIQMGVGLSGRLTTVARGVSRPSRISNMLWQEQLTNIRENQLAGRSIGGGMFT